MTPLLTRKCPSVSSRGVDAVLTGLPLTRSTVFETRPRFRTSLPVAKSSWRSSSTAGSGRIASSPEREAMPSQLISLRDVARGLGAVAQHAELRELGETRLRFVLDRAPRVERAARRGRERARHVALQQDALAPRGGIDARD